MNPIIMLYFQSSNFKTIVYSSQYIKNIAATLIF